MKKLTLEQMVKINGGRFAVNWCAVSVGVAGGGGILLGLGFALAGPIAAAAFAGFAAHAVYCELTS